MSVANTFAPFIVVTGNIAAGKSTLVERAAAELGLEPHIERPEANPFFLVPPLRPLQAELWFLADSVAAHRAIQLGARGGIQERSVLEHAAIFGRARLHNETLDAAELDLLQVLTRQSSEGLKPPDLLVYMEADLTAVQERIAARGRPEEQAIETAYLQLLAGLYDEFVERWRLSPVYRLDTARVDIRDDEGLDIACREFKRILT